MIRKRRVRVKEKEIRIKEIHAAAKKVFSQKGFQQTSMEKIAQVAGVSKGTLYRQCCEPTGGKSGH